MLVFFFLQIASGQEPQGGGGERKLKNKGWLRSEITRFGSLSGLSEHLKAKSPIKNSSREIYLNIKAETDTHKLQHRLRATGFFNHHSSAAVWSLAGVGKRRFWDLIFYVKTKSFAQIKEEKNLTFCTRSQRKCSTSPPEKKVQENKEK